MARRFKKTTRRKARKSTGSKRNTPRRSANRGSRATTQNIRIVLEQAPQAMPQSMPTHLPTIPGTMTVLGKRNRF